MVELCIPKNPMFFDFRAKQINNFEKARHNKIECEEIFEKLNWLKSYSVLIFEFPAILLLFLET